MAICIGDKFCFLCEQCDVKRLKRILFSSKESNYVKKYLDLNIVSGYLCHNCVRVLYNIESKCTKLKKRCESIILKVADVHKYCDDTVSKCTQSTCGVNKSTPNKQCVATPKRQSTPKSNRKKRVLYKSPTVHQFSSLGSRCTSSPSVHSCKKMKRALFDKGTVIC